MRRPRDIHIAIIAPTEVLGLLARDSEGHLPTSWTSETIRAARERLQREPPDVVIISLSVAGISWRELWGGAAPSLPCVVLAQPGEGQAALEALDEGAINYLFWDERTIRDWPRVAARALREWEALHEDATRGPGARGEASFHAIFENASLGICAVSTDGELLAVNQKMGEVFGYEPAALVGTSVNDITHPDDVNVSPSFIQSSLSGEVESAVFEKRYFHKDGHVITGRVSSQLARDREGEPLFFVSTVEDLTEQRQVERRAEEVHRLLQDLLDNAPSMIYAFDRADRCILLNKQTAEILGMDRGQAQGLRREDFPILPEFAEAHRETDLEVIRDGASIEFKERGRGVLAASERVFLTQKFPLLDATGQVTGVCGISRDITQQERDKARIEASEARFRSAFETTGHGMALVSPVGKFIKINQTFCDLVGYSMEAMLATDFQRITHPEDLGLDLENVRRLLDGEVGGYKMEKRYIHADGRFVWVILSVSLVRDSAGSPLHFVSQVIDITERKEAEQALVASEQKYRSLTENFPDSITRYDRAHRHIFVNSVTIEKSGQSLEAFIGSTHRELGFSKALCEMFERTIDEVFETQRTIIKEFEMQSDGSTITVEWRVSPELGRDGEVISVLGISRDITQKKKIEEKLLASQKMDSIGNLAGGVAHDFNNMLAGIMGSASLLQVIEDDPEKLGYLQDILLASDRAAELTRKLLTFGRRGMILDRVVDLNAIVNEAVDILERTIDRRILITRDLDPALELVGADPTQMIQVVMNLCVNAAEAMPKGGQISIQTRNLPPSNPPSKGRPASVRVEIKDSGIGMEGETLRRAFEPFFTTKFDGDVKGTGLGLAVVYGIVKHHGGEIDLVSEVGRGTRITIDLPGRSDALPTMDHDTRALARGQEGRILVVEDEEVLRQSVGSMLEHLGFEVLFACDGREGVEVYEAHHASLDLVLLDLKMPRLDGADAFVLMRAINPEVVVVVSTGYGIAEESEALLQMGVKALCPKPYTIMTLSSVLRRALGTSD